MRRVRRLIDAARRLSENDGTVTSTAGISDEEVVQYLNDAQDHIFNRMEDISSEYFTEEDFISTVRDQEAYGLPPRTYLGSNVLTVEYSRDGSTNYFYMLPFASMKDRNTNTDAQYPNQYILRNGQILLNPIPDSAVTNAVRVNRVVERPRLDKRRAQIDAVTVSSGEVTALTVDITDYTNYFPYATAFSDSSILVDDYFSIVDAAGTIKARNIPITAISTSTGVATITSYTPEETTETAAIGDYLVAGANATTHAQLPDICERFLIHYTAIQLMLRDGTVNIEGQADILQRIEATILNAWSGNVDDVVTPTITDYTYFKI